MNIYEYLKLDHEHVAKLFKQFEASDLPERKHQIVELISQELLIHAHSEQETFYKALKQFESTEEEAMHGQEEHQEIEAQIKLVMSSKEFGASWVKKVEKLKEIVEHHVREEEGPIFRHAKKVLTEEDAYVLKEQMHYLKQHLLLALKKQQITASTEKTAPKKTTSTKKTPVAHKAKSTKPDHRDSRR